MPIKVSCYTNIDAYAKEVWPKTLLFRPTVGDYVRSESGKELRIVRVIHDCIDLVTVELHK